MLEINVSAEFHSIQAASPLLLLPHWDSLIGISPASAKKDPMAEPRDHLDVTVELPIRVKEGAGALTIHCQQLEGLKPAGRTIAFAAELMAGRPIVHLSVDCGP